MQTWGKGVGIYYFHAVEQVPSNRLAELRWTDIDDLSVVSLTPQEVEHHLAEIHEELYWTTVDRAVQDVFDLEQQRVR